MQRPQRASWSTLPTVSVLLKHLRRLSLSAEENMDLTHFLAHHVNELNVVTSLRAENRNASTSLRANATPSHPQIVGAPTKQGLRRFTGSSPCQLDDEAMKCDFPPSLGSTRTPQRKQTQGKNTARTVQISNPCSRRSCLLAHVLCQQSNRLELPALASVPGCPVKTQR